MKIAILLVLAEDRKSGQTITPVLPLDEAKAQFKALSEAGVSPVPGLPVLELWEGRVKSRRLKGTRSTASLEVTAASTGAGEGDLSGEGGAGDLLSIASHGEVSGGPTPGSMAPKGKGKGK
jgi:hypothetical protein